MEKKIKFGIFENPSMKSGNNPLAITRFSVLAVISIFKTIIPSLDWIYTKIKHTVPKMKLKKPVSRTQKFMAAQQMTYCVDKNNLRRKTLVKGSQILSSCSQHPLGLLRSQGTELFLKENSTIQHPPQLLALYYCMKNKIV